MVNALHPPPNIIASWPAPNYEDPVTHSKTVLISACLFTPLTTCIILWRFWFRARIQRALGWDDWAMLMALPFVTALTILCALRTFNAILRRPRLTAAVTTVDQLDRHVWDVEPQYYPIQRKYILVIQCIFAPASGFLKISILLFYRRLSSRTISNAFCWAIWISIGSIAIYSLSFSIIPVFLCTPISAFWDQVNIVKLAQGYTYKCRDEGANVVASAIIAAVQDLITASLPALLYWKLQMSQKQKFAVFVLFAIGYCVVALSALRAYSAWRAFFDTYDAPWMSYTAWLWTILELHIGALCANTPSLKASFRHLRNRAFNPAKLASAVSNGSSNAISASPPSRSKLDRWIWNRLRGRLPYGQPSSTECGREVLESNGIRSATCGARDDCIGRDWESALRDASFEAPSYYEKTLPPLPRMSVGLHIDV